jgi:exo-beta-1,3-glucanase (GH17 family)
MTLTNASINQQWRSLISNIRSTSYGFNCLVILILTLFLISPVQGKQKYKQSIESLMHEETIAVAYSGFRAGQHPDRGNGATTSSDVQVLEDLRILLRHNLGLIRLYNSGKNSEKILNTIKKHQLPIKVLLSVSLEAEVSKHENCPWLEYSTPELELFENKINNMLEIQRGIKLAEDYPENVIAVNIGNEALVDWNIHTLTLDSIIGYVRQVKQTINQPVMVADNYEWWIRDGGSLADEVDFIGVHTYPAWENRTTDKALKHTIKNIENLHQALLNKPIVILEDGWSTTEKKFAGQENEANQKRYFDEIKKWSKANNTTFFFDAFDEPWKGNPDNLNSTEKHWGLFNVDRTPKQVMSPK